MEYLNFDLRIDTPNAHGYPVRVTRAPAGEANDWLQLAFDEPFLTGLQTLERVRGVGTNLRGTQTVTPAPADVSEAALAREVGGALFEALFPGEVRSRYRSSLEMARAQRKHLRVRLRVEAPELALLPWEFLYDADAGDHVNLLRETPVTRYLEMGRPTPPLTIPPPIRILGMIASPADLPALDAEQEKQRMVQAIDHLLEARSVELAWVEGQSWRDLNRALQSGEWHIFHFIGHGDFDPAEGEGRIALVDEASGDSHCLSATQLGRLFDDYRSLRLAVLNACEGARASADNLFSSTGAVLSRRGIPAVVSMQYAISDRAAIEFSRAFYDSLARGLGVDESVQEARLAISMALADRSEWATPVLHLRAEEGALFRVDLAGAIFRGQSAVPPPAPATPPPPPVSAAAGEERRGLEILLRKVRQYWIEGVLEKSLFQAILLDLGMARMSGAVDSPFAASVWGEVVERPDGESQPLPPEQSLADLYDEEGGSLLVLGEPGSGKTTSLLELAKGLLARAESDPRRPVPVVFNLSSWVEPHSELDTWLVDELSSRYQIPRKIGRVWLAESRLLPLLDGLDELATPRRAACVEAINRFSQGAGLVGAVVCCRLAEYIDLPVRLSLNAAVRLLPLDDEQVQGYLTGLGERLDGLRALLQRDSALHIEARSPLMLSLMVRAYQDVPAEYISYGSISTSKERHEYVIDSYVTRIIPQVSASYRQVQNDSEQGVRAYSNEQVIKWLTWLARSMTEHGQTIFQIEELQCSWLSIGGQQWSYILVSRLIWGIMSGIIVGPFLGLPIGLIGGLVNGFAIGLFDAIRINDKNIEIERNASSILQKVILRSVAIGLGCGLYFGLFLGSSVDMPLGLFFGWFFGLALGPVWVFRSQTRGVKNEIKPVETIRFLASSFPKGFRNGLIVGLGIGSIVGLVVGLLGEIQGGLVVTLIVGVIVGVFSGLLSSFQPDIQGLKTIPNQGIWLSFRSAVLSAGIGILCFSFITGYLGHDWIYTTIYTVLLGLCIGLWYGGLDVIQHFLVRFLLWRSGSLPWRLAPFLDYAAEELHFLQKVGGGYIFVHRYLLEHFAAMETDDGRPRTADVG